MTTSPDPRLTVRPGGSIIARMSTKNPPRQPAPTEDDRLYTPDEAAALIAVKRRTLEEMWLDGRVRTVKVGGRHKIPAAEVRRILTEGT